MMRVVVLIAAVGACGPSPANDDAAPSADAPVTADAPDASCPLACSADLHAVVDCHGAVVSSCSTNEACEPVGLTCESACDAAAAHRQSGGCSFYAADMDLQEYSSGCFAAVVANTWTSPVHLAVEYMGQPLDVATFTRLPSGGGTNLTYSPYDAATGLPPGEIALLFLTGTMPSSVPCPITPAVSDTGTTGTGVFSAFKITTDVPVAAYQINPYGGGSAAVTGASLLLPTSVWGDSYSVFGAAPKGIAGRPSFNVVAEQDDTVVTLTPSVDLVGGTGIAATAANTPVTITLQRGQHAQITQDVEVTGSLTSNKPVGFFAGSSCLNVPSNVAYCDHAEQMVPPVHSLGSRYVGVMYRPRVATETATFWRVVGTVDDTHLTWSEDVGGPTTLAKGQTFTFSTGTPFIVSSQDAQHPFALFTYMTGSTYVGDGYGDADFVSSVPPEQYLSRYVFFTDPTYPETHLVVVRGRGIDGQFHDVDLDCLGVLPDWTPVGNDFMFARVELTTGDFANVGQCSTGRHSITSDAPFGLWVWGWGTPQTSGFTQNVSYGYPGGMNVQPINQVIL